MTDSKKCCGYYGHHHVPKTLSEVRQILESRSISHNTVEKVLTAIAFKECAHCSGSGKVFTVEGVWQPNAITCDQCGGSGEYQTPVDALDEVTELKRTIKTLTEEHDYRISKMDQAIRMSVHRAEFWKARALAAEGGDSSEQEKGCPFDEDLS